MTRMGSVWYSLLVRGFPAEFRDRFGGEMLEVIEAQARASSRNDEAALRFHLEATVDLLRALATERGRDVLRAGGWALLTLGFANIAYDIAQPTLSMGYFAWALTLIALSSGYLLSATPSRRRRPG